MIVVVLGANGILGSKICPYLENKGHVVYKLIRPKCENISLQEEIFYQNLKSLINKCKPEIILNLVAQTDVSFCEKNINSAYKSNVMVTEKIVEVIDINRTHLIHISTDQIYDGVGPHIEINASPCNVYGLSKYFGEIIASRVNATIFRTNYVAKTQNKNKQSFVDWIVESLSNDLEIILFKDIYFSPLHIDMLCEVIEDSFFKKISGVFNVGSIGSISKANFAKEIAKGLKIKYSKAKVGIYSDLKNNFKRPLDMSLNSNKYLKSFDLKLPLIEDTIKAVISDFLR